MSSQPEIPPTAVYLSRFAIVDMINDHLESNMVRANNGQVFNAGSLKIRDVSMENGDVRCEIFKLRENPDKEIVSTLKRLVSQTQSVIKMFEYGEPSMIKPENVRFPKTKRTMLIGDFVIIDERETGS